MFYSQADIAPSTHVVDVVRSNHITKIANSWYKKLCFFQMHCYGHNFVIIGLILEILDVLSSPDHVASKFGTFVR